MEDLLLAVAAEFAAHDLDWSQGREFKMPASFQGRFAYCETAGPDGMTPAEGLRFGAYLQHPDTWYPVWYPIHTAEWTRNGADGQPERPGTLIRHASYEGHATRTLAEPLLALWAWQGDLHLGSYRVESA
jgi:hypothetical protein